MKKKIVFSSSFIDFLRQSDCKVAQLLYKLQNKPYNSAMLTDSEVNYITFRQDGTISFLPSGKEHKTNEDTGVWKRDGRQNGKPGKVIKKLFTVRAQKYFKDADFECFANSYKANFNDDGYTFEMLPNKQIPSVYEMEIATGQGSLNNSCMNGDSQYLDIYKNCAALQILILKNKDGLLCGRALVWKINEDITLIDRFYVTQDFMFDKFLMYATENKYWRKKDYKSYDNKQTFINPEGKEISKQFDIYTSTDFDSFPYIDTFQYGNDGSLNNYGDGCYTYNNTDGCRDGGEENHDEESYDDINECYISNDDAIYIEHGERCYRDRTCHIEDCVEAGGNWYYKDDENIVEIGGTYYETDDDDICCVNDNYELKEDCTYCERDGCYYLSDDCVFCEDDEEDVLRDEAVEINGKWYHKDSDKVIEIAGEFYTEDSDEICEINGEYYKKDDDKVIEIDGEYTLRQAILPLKTKRTKKVA